jgi:hypothetical protein
MSALRPGKLLKSERSLIHGHPDAYASEAEAIGVAGPYSLVKLGSTSLQYDCQSEGRGNTVRLHSQHSDEDSRYPGDARGKVSWAIEYKKCHLVRPETSIFDAAEDQEHPSTLDLLKGPDFVIGRPKEGSDKTKGYVIEQRERVYVQTEDSTWTSYFRPEIMIIPRRRENYEVKDSTGELSVQISADLWIRNSSPIIAKCRECVSHVDYALFAITHLAQGSTCTHAIGCSCVPSSEAGL